MTGARAVQICFRVFLTRGRCLARLCAFDRAVYVNNWLLSTSLPPTALAATASASSSCGAGAGDGGDAALRGELHALTHALCASTPRHALVFRCVDGRGSGGLMGALASLGWAAVPARYVQPPSKGTPITVASYEPH